VLELFGRFLTIGALAFGGGEAALPIVERLTVADTGWLTPAQFATGVALSFATPGPVLILAAFIGYHVAAFPGALAATVGVFAVPVLVAGFAAQVVNKFKEASWFRAFGCSAAAAAIGLLGVTLVAIARPLIDLHPVLLLAPIMVFGADRNGVHPIILIAGAALLGAASSLL
jgi:chromate transporter